MLLEIGVRRTGRILALLALAAALLASVAGAAPTRAAANTATYQQTFPFATVYPAQATCTGEPIRVGGEVHLVAHVTVDEHGGGVVVLHSNLQGASGTGLLSGTAYEVVTVGNRHGEAVYGSLPQTFTTQVRSLVVAPGGQNNFAMTNAFHVTINANGELTALVSDFSSECR